MRAEAAVASSIVPAAVAVARLLEVASARMVAVAGRTVVRRAVAGPSVVPRAVAAVASRPMATVGVAASRPMA
ncbi:MAG: hypothetical protein ABWZ99_13540, partial [Ilumatobacteraceae bacterium]